MSQNRYPRDFVKEARQLSNVSSIGRQRSITTLEKEQSQIASLKGMIAKQNRKGKRFLEKL